MTTTEITKVAIQLLKQYRDIPSMDKSRDMLVSKYGAESFDAIRQQFARLWLSNNGIVIDEPKKAKTDVHKKKKNVKTQGMRDLESRLKGGKKRLTRYEKEQSARAAAIISPKPGPKVPHPYPDKVKDESVTTHRSIHTLRG